MAKYCVDCKHHLTMDDIYYCSLEIDSADVDLVTGIRPITYISCRLIRSGKNEKYQCNAEGRAFESSFINTFFQETL